MCGTIEGMTSKPKITDEQLRTLKPRFEDAVRQLEEQRAGELRAAVAQGKGVVELANLTGYSRETIRHFLNPEARAAHNRRRTKAGKAEGTEAG